MWGSVLATGDPPVRKTDRYSYLHGAYVLAGRAVETIDKQYEKIEIN